MAPNALRTPPISSPSSPVSLDWSEKQVWPRSPETDGSVTAVGEDAPDRDPENLEKKKVDRSVRHYLKRLSASSKLDAVPENKQSENEEYAEPDFQRIDAHPIGYPRLASYMNSDENFLITRKYGVLHNRVLLCRQDELRDLEEQLFELDAQDAQDEEGDGKLALTSRLVDDRREGSMRKALIQEIDEKLREYDDIVLRTRRMNSLTRATPRNYRSLDNWIHHTAPLSSTEAEFIKKDLDFVALVDPPELSGFDSLVEDILSLIPCRLTRWLFINKRNRDSTEDHLVRLYSKQRIDTFVRLIVTLLAVGLLMAPVAVLFSGRESGTMSIIVILIFTLFFSAALSIFTKAKRHELFAATAAYLAVLVVFLGNFMPYGT